jgi:indole-3-glycerol phosphate synthase
VSGFLEQMRQGSVERARELCAVDLRARLADRAAPKPLRIDRFGLIAEVKRISPAEGELGNDANPLATVAARARCYAEAGAVAISVLTEPSRFGGEMSHLSAAAAASDAPVMRKDFLVHPDQVLEAAAAGASGVLLIVRMVSEAVLMAQVDCAKELGLFVLLEAFDGADIDGAQRVGHGLIGVNCRDLQTLAVDRARFSALALPPGAVGVAESGLHTAADVAIVARLGFSLALVGTALMRAADPGRVVQQLTDAGRQAQEETRCASA